MVLRQIINAWLCKGKPLAWASILIIFILPSLPMRADLSWTQLIAQPQFHGMFTGINEYYHFVFYPLLDDSKADEVHMAVGTHRAISAGLRGGYAEVLLVDYDASTGLYNHFLLELIRISGGDRRKFLSLLLTGKWHRDLIRQNREGEIDDWEFVFALAERGPRDRWPVTEWLQKGVVLPKIPQLQNALTGLAEYRGHTKFTSDEDAEPYFSFLADLRSVFDSGSWQHQYFGNDKLFKKAYAMVKANKFKIVIANLAQTTSYRGLSSIIASEKHRLRSLDISNLYDYIHNDAIWERMIKGILSLPWSEGGAVIWSASPARFGKAAHQRPMEAGVLTMVSIEDFRKAAARGYLETKEKFGKYLKRLGENNHVWHDPHLVVSKSIEKSLPCGFVIKR